MAGSSFGEIFRVTTFGESHGLGIGVIVDGIPSGIELSESDIQAYLNRRKPGQSQFTTPRIEDDACKIFSGVFGGKTTGTPIMVLIENTSQKSSDYDKLKDIYRPGHADFGFDSKYGFRDYRGGGRSSGRETIARVVGGAIAAKALSYLGISVSAFTQSIGHVHAKEFDLDQCSQNALYMPDKIAAAEAGNYIQALKATNDSSGGLIGCIVTGMPTGVGEPVFDKLDAKLAQAIMSIGAIKGIEFGAGFAVASMKGSQDNDQFTITNVDGVEKITKKTNNAGGILGGISDGSPIILSVAVKPTSSISKKQTTINTDKKETEIEIGGRHDPVIVPRAVVVVESMVSITIFDLILRNMSARIEHVMKVYGK